MSLEMDSYCIPIQTHSVLGFQCLAQGHVDMQTPGVASQRTAAAPPTPGARLLSGNYQRK